MSAFNVEAFRNRLTNGGSRPNQFKVDLGSRVGSELSSFLVTSASLPGQTIGTASVFYRGREVKLAGDKVFAAWTTTIINDSELRIRALIEDWMQRIENNETKVTDLPSQNLTGYASDLTVHQLDKNGREIRSYTLIGAWPTDVSEIGLDYGANDTISTFSCTWNYQHFIISDSGISGFVVSGEGE